MNFAFLIQRSTIIETIWRQRKSTGGFGAYALRNSFLEATCWVIKAMEACGESSKYNIAVNDLIEMTKATIMHDQSTFTLTFVLSTLLEAYANTQNTNLVQLCLTLKEQLVKRAITNTNTCWGYENEGLPTDTAHAFICLKKYCEVFDAEKELSPLEESAALYILSSREDWIDQQERIRINGEEMVYEHYALPWCLLALMHAGLPSTHQAIVSGVKALMSSYRNGSWKRANQVKIWEIYDAICVIERYNSEILL